MLYFKQDQNNFVSTLTSEQFPVAIMSYYMSSYAIFMVFVCISENKVQCFCPAVSDKMV